MPQNHQVQWYRWVSDLLERAPVSADRDALDQALRPYRCAVRDCWLLLGTPPLVRAVVNSWQANPDAPVDQGIAMNLVDLLASYDSTRPAQ